TGTAPERQASVQAVPRPITTRLRGALWRPEACRGAWHPGTDPWQTTSQPSGRRIRGVRFSRLHPSAAHAQGRKPMEPVSNRRARRRRARTGELSVGVTLAALAASLPAAAATDPSTVLSPTEYSVTVGATAVPVEDLFLPTDA